LDDKEKIGPEKSEEEEKYKSFFELDESEDWGDDLEEEEVREKIKEHKVKSMKERKRLGDKKETHSKNIRKK
jgi:hypothetical protein